MLLVRKLAARVANLRDCAILQIMKVAWGKQRSLSCMIKVTARKNNAASIFLWSILRESHEHTSIGWQYSYKYL